MRIKKITLYNFQIFEKEKTFLFKSINFIKGKNGIGKSTLTLYSILFVLYGYSPKKLEDIPTKNRSKRASVTIHLDFKGKSYTLTREYPTKLVISENGVILDFPNSREAERYIVSLFGSLQYFKKFRTIDINEGINLVEEGSTSLRKTLCSIYEDFFNDIRHNLLDIKRDRELFNKDRLNTYKIFPSKKRLLILDKNIEYTESEISDVSHKIANASNIKNEVIKDGGIKETQKNYLEKELTDLNKFNHCPFCKQTLTKEFITSKKENIIVNITNRTKELINIIDELKIRDGLLENFRTSFTGLYDKKERLLDLKFKLENRLKQKDFKYTNKDILIVREALTELDNFSSNYVIRYIRTLEPIINSILEKIGFIIEFKIDEKNNLDYNLYKDKIKYTKKDLSTGQKLILQIALKLAILLQKGESGLIIADEGMASLDKDNLLHIIDLIQGLPFQLFFVIHNCDFLPYYVNVIELKEDNISIQNDSRKGYERSSHVLL